MALVAGSAVVAGPAVTSAAPATVGQQYLPLVPMRDLDTRPGFIYPNSTVTRDGESLGGGIGVTLVLNVTVVDPSGAGYVSVYAADSGPATVSAVNFAAHQTITNLAIVTVGASDKVVFENVGSATINLIIDTVGVMYSGTGETTYVPRTPVRILDTRNGTGGYVAPVAGRSTIPVRVAGTHGIPADATSVVVNLTTVNPATYGYMQAFGGDYIRPYTSVSNWSAHQTIANLAVIQLGDDGNFDLSNMGTGAADFVADVVGYFIVSDVRARFVPRSAPVRVLDTRYAIGVPSAAKVGAGQSIVLHVAGANGVPASGVAAVHLNLTATNATSTGFLTLYPHGSARPVASSLNFAAGQTVANATVMPVGPDGSITIYNGGSQAVNVIADLYGYYAS